jgi:hypothetical protein
MDHEASRALSEALAGDQYAWLQDALPSPEQVPCPQCETPMGFRTTPALLSCPTCYPGEVTQNA